MAALFHSRAQQLATEFAIQATMVVSSRHNDALVCKRLADGPTGFLLRCEGKHLHQSAARIEEASQRVKVRRPDCVLWVRAAIPGGSDDKRALDVYS